MNINIKIQNINTIAIIEATNKLGYFFEKKLKKGKIILVYSSHYN